MSANPPFIATPAILALVAAIGEQVCRLEVSSPPDRQLQLRRANKIRAIQDRLAIESNTLSIEPLAAEAELVHAA